jgi:hypothetical protein
LELSVAVKKGDADMQAKTALLVAILVIGMCVLTTQAYAPPADGRGERDDHVHFVPNSQEFWDFSKNWTTNFGPAYRDTVLPLPTQGFVPCTGIYALCSHSGPEPLPCELTEDGRFANCKCTVQSGMSFVEITAILNYEVYQETVEKCGPDGSDCAGHVNLAPVCKAINQGRLVPGADVISTYSPSFMSDLASLQPTSAPNSSIKICSKGPYAGCMTAPCKKTKPGYAICSCPIFWGIFQLVGPPSASCTLGDDLVWSASYDPNKDGTE